MLMPHGCAVDAPQAHASGIGDTRMAENGKPEAYDTEEPKPIRYYLEFYKDSFGNDSAAFESSTPFILPSVGDYVSMRQSGWPLAVDIAADEDLKVVAVRHSFQDLGSHIGQHVWVCVESAIKRHG